MPIATYLKPLRFLFAIGVLAAALGLLENRQKTTHGHLQDRVHARGHLRLETKSLEELASVLLERYPHTATPNLYMGTALVEQGRLREARDYLEKAMEINPRNQELLFLYARLLVDLGEQPARIRSVVADIGRYFPRSKDRVQAFFEEASRGRVSFDREPY